MGAGAGTDLTLRQHGRDEGQLRRGPAACCPTWRASRRSRRRKSSGSGSRCCRACRSASRIPGTSPTPCSIGSSTASIRTACRRTARRRRSPASRATICSRFTRSFFAPNNAILAIVGDVTGRGSVRGRRRRCSATGRSATCRRRRSSSPPDPTRRVIVVNKPDAVQTEVRVGHIGIPRNHPDYMAVNLAIRILGGEGSNRLAPGAADRARPDLRRAGQHGHAEGERRLRGRDQHAIRRDRRGAAAHRRRVLAAAARARRRARARRTRRRTSPAAFR